MLNGEKWIFTINQSVKRVFQVFFYELLPGLSQELLAKKANTLAEDTECTQDPKEKQYTFSSCIFLTDGKIIALYCNGGLHHHFTENECFSNV